MRLQSCCANVEVRQPSSSVWPFLRAPQEVLPAHSAQAASGEEAQLGCHVFAPQMSLPASVRPTAAAMKRTVDVADMSFVYLFEVAKCPTLITRCSRN